MVIGIDSVTIGYLSTSLDVSKAVCTYVIETRLLQCYQAFIHKTHRFLSEFYTLPLRHDFHPLSISIDLAHEPYSPDHIQVSDVLWSIKTMDFYPDSHPSSVRA